MYKVINEFIDLQNGNIHYKVGGIYPKGDYKPTKKRISELSKEHPKYKCRFIEKVEE
ncbi:hypothetical protein [Cytobacillus depressus]|uniref:hypothetical protein n=1 Tax=Cytobacillus depressus TaxID=1602942 RepID=UPI0014794EE4|nr:hypothetical protein [Cytobacillus depressus]